MKIPSALKIAGLVVVSFALLGCLVLIGLVQVMLAPRPTTDISRYSEIRSQYWHNPVLIQHFPPSLPPEATNVRMAYFGGFLQAGAYFQLRLKLPLSQIESLLAQYSAVATHRYSGGDTNDHANQTNGVPTTFFYTSGSTDHSFPSTYEILVLDAEPYGTPDSAWNHGYSYGVAIDSSASEIVYWVEDW